MCLWTFSMRPLICLETGSSGRPPPPAKLDGVGMLFCGTVRSCGCPPFVPRPMASAPIDPAVAPDILPPPTPPPGAAPPKLGLPPIIPPALFSIPSSFMIRKASFTCVRKSPLKAFISASYSFFLWSICSLACSPIQRTCSFCEASPASSSLSAVLLAFSDSSVGVMPTMRGAISRSKTCMLLWTSAITTVSRRISGELASTFAFGSRRGNSAGIFASIPFGRASLNSSRTRFECDRMSFKNFSTSSRNCFSSARPSCRPSRSSFCAVRSMFCTRMLSSSASMPCSTRRSSYVNCDDCAAVCTCANRGFSCSKSAMAFCKSKKRNSSWDGCC
mmetsp:Transcript_17235/g.42751  ORF Transcript_17235/g.42751 Transcript_17235/m.42751 type:complete len:332 (+) Transcript_17235:1379-2374(+)